MLGFANRFGFRPLRKGVIKMVKGSIEGHSKTERFFRVAVVRAKKSKGLFVEDRTAREWGLD